MVGKAMTAELTPEQRETARDLAAALFFARNALAEAERVEHRCELAVIDFLTEIEQQSMLSEEHHFTATKTVRRTAKVRDKTQLMAGLTEIGMVPKMKESLDTNWLLKVADMYEGDFPGVDVAETEYLVVKGRTR